MKRIITLMVLAGCSVTSSHPMIANQTTSAAKPARADTPIPDQFRPLYRELDETLRQANDVYPFNKRGQRGLVAPYLFISANVFRSAASNSQPWQELLLTLDTFKAM